MSVGLVPLIGVATESSCIVPQIGSTAAHGFETARGCMIEIFNVSRDEVIKSAVSSGKTTYGFALDNLVPLIDKFQEQRKIQGRKFYERLKADIIRGCIMPPITLAFTSDRFCSESVAGPIQTFITNNITEGYILDGMQRLNTLVEASRDAKFDRSRPLFLNIIIAERYDFLLYRMVTLNNGQKPMTARHQIEMLTKGILDTETFKIPIVSEKDTEKVKPQGAFKRADIAAAYTAFLTNSVNNENSRIIESKLDEILVGKVMDSNLIESDVSFHDVLKEVERMSDNIFARDWLRLGNNLIGFTVGARKSLSVLASMTPENFAAATDTFEAAFLGLDVSKINVGKFRRNLSRLFVEKIEKYAEADSEALLEAFMEETLVD